MADSGQVVLVVRDDNLERLFQWWRTYKMKKYLLVTSAAFAIAIAAVAVPQSPAYACAGQVAEGFPNGAFQPSGNGSFSLGGETDSAPRFGKGGSILIPSEAGAQANSNSPLEQRDIDAENGQSLVRKTDCPDPPKKSGRSPLQYVSQILRAVAFGIER
jgi:hypothetical protein